MKTKQELETKLKFIESDKRLEYELAVIAINAPLALEQLSLKTQADLLRWALELPYRKHHGKD